MCNMDDEIDHGVRQRTISRNYVSKRAEDDEGVRRKNADS